MTRDGSKGFSSSKSDGRYARPVVLGWLMFLLGLLAPGWLCAQHADPERVAYFAGTGNPALDQHVQDLLQAELGDSVVLQPISDDNLSSVADAPVVALGPSAFSRVRQGNRSTPILALLVEKSFLDGFQSPGQISGIYFDVPLLRQALTGKVILPHANTVSLLATPDSVFRYEPLVDELTDYGMKAKVFIVANEEELIPSLVRALVYGDFLLATPEEEIYNPRTIKHVLLTAYRRNRIVIGPSQAYVRAGALASSYTPFPAMARHGAQFLQQYFRTGAFPAPAYPDAYAVEVNEQVARSLNIPVPENEYIRQSVEDALTGEGGLQSEQ
ncbi:ABC transporter substrate-binding protein [Marinobacter salinisoli]|uniref:ABC transporter substrate-binding protein n=1 Tax=Marinobacter salinisoli TaxID=2769486 RepID=A0ABX7MUL3_9GAMM|nr:ABC transporter substrate-binding protein [Marinobacter salinisoli]QSP93948.1 ABC transporter substrate-binding protein [Marinobacter salinisoli]